MTFRKKKKTWSKTLVFKKVFLTINSDFWNQKIYKFDNKYKIDIIEQ